MVNIQLSLFGRTYPVLFHQQTEQILEPCLKKSQKPVFQCLQVAGGQPQEWLEGERLTQLGECLTPNFGEYPNVERESTLSEILEDNVPEKYSLSPKACLGIIRRAKAKGRKLPENLRIALEQKIAEQGGEIIGLDFAHADSVVRTFEDKTPTLLQNMGSAGGQIPCVMHERRTVAGFTYNQGGEGKGLGFEEEKAPTIMTGGRGAAFMEKKSVIPLRDEVTRNKASNGLGVGEVGGPCPTLTTADVHSVFYEAYQHHGYRESSTSGTLTADQNSTIRGDTPLVCKEVKYYEGQQFGNYKESDVAGTVLAGQAKIVNNGTGIIVEKNRKAFELNQHGGYRETDASGTLRAAGGDYGGGSETIITESHRTKENTPSKPRSIKDILKKAVQRVIYVIRRLTPVECERLQGYPDNWTKYGADGTEIADTARYRAIGNSICVFCAERVYLGILDALTEVSESEREKENIL